MKTYHSVDGDNNNMREEEERFVTTSAKGAQVNTASQGIDLVSNEEKVMAEREDLLNMKGRWSFIIMFACL